MVRLILATIFGLLLTVPTQAATLSFELSRSPGTLLPGDLLDVVLKSDPDAEDIAAGSFDLHYDANILRYLGTDFAGTAFTIALDRKEQAADAQGPTTIHNVMFTVMPTSSGSGTGGGEHTLATLMFEAIAPGATQIMISEGGNVFAKGPVFLGGPGDENPSLDVTMPDPVDVVVTPIPAALPLFATGLIALGLVARRRKPHAAS